MKESLKIILQGVKYSINKVSDNLVKRIQNVEEKIPNSLTNPYSLKLTGIVEATYDGSEEITVEIPTTAGPKGDKGDKGDKGEPGVSGVYVGSGEMPEGCNVQIDPDAEGEEFAKKQYVDGLFTEYIEEVAALVGGDA